MTSIESLERTQRARSLAPHIRNSLFTFAGQSYYDLHKLVFDPGVSSDLGAWVKSYIDELKIDVLCGIGVDAAPIVSSVVMYCAKNNYMPSYVQGAMALTSGILDLNFKVRDLESHRGKRILLLQNVSAKDLVNPVIDLFASVNAKTLALVTLTTTQKEIGLRVADVISCYLFNQDAPNDNG